MSSAEHPSVALFREYLRIKSVQPEPDYEGCVDFLKSRAEEIGLPCKILELVPGKPIVIMSWFGKDPKLPSLLLNSHTDVVPVFRDSWKFDPFEAHKDENGDIYARGTQDMKSVGIQHLEAIRRLKEDGKSYERTIHLSFVPDEEVGGHDGMVKLLSRKEFLDLNVGFSLDEGLASGEDSDVMPLYYGERNCWWVTFSCTGNVGHGSTFVKNTAASKAQYLINKLLGLREEQRLKLESDPTATLGDVSTVNLTSMSGGIAGNIVPQTFSLGFDIRIVPGTDLSKFEEQLNNWCKEACLSAGGDGTEVTTTYSNKFMGKNVTSVAENDPWYKGFKKGAELSKIKIDPRIFPGGTDSRYLREIGIPSFGFSPMPRTPMLLHDHNEKLNEVIFLEGIDIFYNVIDSMASVEI